MIAEEEDILWLDTFDDARGTEAEAEALAAADSSAAALACLSVCLRAEYKSREGFGAVPAGSFGISGTPKAFFTPGALSTAKFKFSRDMVYRHRNLKKNCHISWQFKVK